MKSGGRRILSEGTSRRHEGANKKIDSQIRTDARTERMDSEISSYSPQTIDRHSLGEPSTTASPWTRGWRHNYGEV